MVLATASIILQQNVLLACIVTAQVSLALILLQDLIMRMIAINILTHVLIHVQRLARAAVVQEQARALQQATQHSLFRDLYVLAQAQTHPFHALIIVLTQHLYVSITAHIIIGIHAQEHHLHALPLQEFSA
jgi:hypothetical protein